jgi:hypothetical protein
MKEQDLLDLDFTRVDETAKNSGAPTNWHYYEYDIASFSLITPASDEVKDGEWYVEVFETPEIRFTSRTELEILMTLLINNCREKK